MGWPGRCAGADSRLRIPALNETLDPEPQASRHSGMHPAGMGCSGAPLCCSHPQARSLSGLIWRMRHKARLTGMDAKLPLPLSTGLAQLAQLGRGSDNNFYHPSLPRGQWDQEQLPEKPVCGGVGWQLY